MEEKVSMQLTIEEIREKYLSERASLRLFDINLWIGPALEPTFHKNEGFDFVKTACEENAIWGGVVSHSAGFLYDAEKSNAWLQEAVDSKGFWHSITATPEMFFNKRDGIRYVEEMVGRGARIVRIFPKKYNFNFQPWCVDKMVETLIDFQLPLMVWQTEVGWNDIHSIASAYPQLQIIIEGNPQKILYHNRRYFPLLEEHNNIFLELHNLIGYMAVEDIVNNFGGNRIVFGTNMPYWDPNAAGMLLCGARISDSNKKMIAHENLEKMIKTVKTN